MPDEKLTETVVTPDTEIVPGGAIQENQPVIGESLEAQIERMNAALKKANHEAAKYRKQAEAFEQDAKAKADAELTELEKAKRRNEELENQFKAERLTRLQIETATKIGLPLVFASRLKGETPEELEEDAKAILEALPAAQKSKPPEGNVTNPGDKSNLKETEAQKRDRIFGKGPGIFDDEFVKSHGGGVIFTEKTEV